MKRKNKGEEVKATHIKNHLAIYVNALIVNPGDYQKCKQFLITFYYPIALNIFTAFDSQTKETLTTRPAAFGSTCELSEKLLKQV